MSNAFKLALSQFTQDALASVEDYEIIQCRALDMIDLQGIYNQFNIQRVELPRVSYVNEFIDEVGKMSIGAYGPDFLSLKGNVDNTQITYLGNIGIVDFEAREGSGFIGSQQVMFVAKS
jgi:hypothetical protein